MNTTICVSNGIYKACENVPRGLYLGIYYHTTSRSYALGSGLHRPCTIAHRAYSSRARRLKDNAVGKATPNKGMKPATQQQPLGAGSGQLGTTPAALTKDYSPTTSKPDIVSGSNISTAKTVLSRSRDPTVELKGPSQKFGGHIHVALYLQFAHKPTAYPERLLIWNAGVFRNAFIGITNIAPLVFMGWGLIYWAPSYIISPELSGWYAIPGSCSRNHSPLVLRIDLQS
jgi:hypothetical protein